MIAETHLFIPWSHLLHPLEGLGYDFWSGIGSDLGELTIVLVLWRHLNCHAEGCWRPARHQMGGFCRRHRRP